MLLPSAEDLERLSRRAIIAYAVRCARRVSPVLRGTLNDPIVEEALNIAEKVAFSHELDQLDFVSIPNVGVRVTEMLCRLKTRQERLATLAILSTLKIAGNALSVREEKLQYYQTEAASEAEYIANKHDVLEEPAATAAFEAACRDYDFLVKTVRRLNDLTLGDPIDFSVLDRKGGEMLTLDIIEASCSAQKSAPFGNGEIGEEYDTSEVQKLLAMAREQAEIALAIKKKGGQIP